MPERERKVGIVAAVLERGPSEKAGVDKVDIDIHVKGGGLTVQEWREVHKFLGVEIERRFGDVKTRTVGDLQVRHVGGTDEV